MLTGPRQRKNGPGEGNDMADDLQPWEQPGAVRRDCEPHRGPWLHLLGGSALACGVLSVLVPLGVPLGLILGVWVARECTADLAKMRAGLMDPAGREVAVNARGLGFAGLVMSVVFGALWTIILLAVLTRR
jgi:hypothetical protein